MKKILCLLLASLIILSAVPVLAEEAPLEYGEFYYVIKGDYAVITGLIKGSDRYEITDNQSGVEKKILSQSVLTVPYTIDGKKVELEEGAFRGEKGFKKIVFEEGINYIPDYLCCEMPNLEEVVLPASLVEIGSYAFKDTKLKSIDLKTVEKIGKYAFYGCEFKEIKIPDTITEIGNVAFYCPGLESMEIGSGFNITSNLFFTSTKLSKIQVSENNPYIKSMDDVVYDKAGERLITYPAGKAAASFNIPEGVKIIESGAFQHTNFESITVPESVTKFCDDATDGVETVYYMGTREEWDKIVIENNNFNLERAVVYCKNNEVKNIYGNLRLQEKEDVVLILGLVDETEKSVTIPGEINGKRTQLQSSAFYNTDIVTVTLDERIKTIPYNAFGLCSKLENINLENVEHMESQAFKGCSSLKEVNLLNIKSWDGIGQDRLNLDTMEFKLLLNPNMLTYNSSSFYTIFYDANIETLRIKWPEENFAEGEETFPALFLNCNINTVVFENFTISPSPAEFCGIDPSGRNKEIDPYVDLVGVSEELVICGNDEKVQEYAKAIGATFKSTIGIKVDGEALYTDTIPYIKNNRTMVPMRAIFEALGAEVTWDDATKTAIAVKDDTEVRITIGENVIYKNSRAIAIDCAAEITNDRTMVPVRVISEAFYYTVKWDDETKTVKITSNSNEYKKALLRFDSSEWTITGKTETDWGTIVERKHVGMLSLTDGRDYENYIAYVTYDAKVLELSDYAPNIDDVNKMHYDKIEVNDEFATITYPEIKNAGTFVITIDLVNCTAERDIIPYVEKEEPTKEATEEIAEPAVGGLCEGYFWVDEGSRPEVTVEWEYYNSTLTISGTGDMHGFYYTYGGRKTTTVTLGEPWKEYYDKIEKVVIKEGVNSVSRYAFTGCVNLKEVVVADNVTIGTEAFKGLKKLEKVTLGKNCTLERNAFIACTSLVNITIPDGTMIGEGAFNHCYSLRNVYYEGDNISVDETAFDNCPWIEYTTKTKEYEDWFTWRSLPGAYIQKKTETDYGTIVEWSTLSYSKVEGSKVHTYISYVRYDGENVAVDAPMIDETQIRKYKSLEISADGKEAIITYPETENEGTVIITVDLVNCTTAKAVVPYVNTNDTDN